MPGRFRSWLGRMSPCIDRVVCGEQIGEATRSATAILTLLPSDTLISQRLYVQAFRKIGQFPLQCIFVVEQFNRYSF